jgi:leucyl aminopeptidase (aminopeptidase T)
MDTRLEKGARGALKNCLNLSRKERLLVVCDAPCQSIGEAFFLAGQRLCKESVMVQIVPRRQDGNEPPEPVGEWFGQFDVAVMPTSCSLSHTNARRQASERGCRIATLPGITEESFVRTMGVAWDKLGVSTRKVASQLSQARTIRVTTVAGTDISFATGGRHAHADDGRLNHPGAFGNLPAGEAFLAPLEGTAQGRVVIDGSFALAGLLDAPLVLDVKDGLVREASGHSCCQELHKLFIRYRQGARAIAEFGVGTLSTAQLCGNVLEDEKVAGTIHFALGNNMSMGGTVNVPLHLDGVVRSPSVWLDGELWMEQGALVAR